MMLFRTLIQAFHTKGYIAIDYDLELVGIVGSNPAAPMQSGAADSAVPVLFGS